MILFVDNKADANHFMVGAIIFGILSLSCYLACYKMSIERITVDETDKPKVNFGQTVKGLVKNKPLIWILVASLSFMIVFMLIGAVNVYLFKDYFGNAKALSMVGLLQAVAVFIAMPFVKPLVAKFGKKEVASAGILLAAVVYGIIILLTKLNCNSIYCHSINCNVWLWNF